MQWMARTTGTMLVMVMVLVATVWGAMALWYRLPAPDLSRGAATGVFGLIGASTALSLFGERRLRRLAGFAVLFAALLVWWSTITPPATGDWDPSVARQTTGRIEGDRLILENVRNFDWRSEEDFTPRWESREYDLSKLKGVDLFLSYWSGPSMAHLILSFGFDDGRYLAWSVEVRREATSGFSPIADQFKEHTVSILAADERDVIGVRSNIRGEDVQIYRLATSPTGARRLIEEYVRDANAVAVRPEFFNSLTTNCTTTVVRMMRAVGATVPFDWRLIVNGYLPDYAYARGALDMLVPLPDLRAASHIRDRALAHGLTDGFSQAIRQGVPSPVVR